MRRRFFLRGLGVSLALCAWPDALLHIARPAQAARGKEQERLVSHLPALPILMLHKVDDQPRYPEDLSSSQLHAVLDYAWSKGFRPVNMSDIVQDRVDEIVPRGLKPLGITADDAHRSVVFSRETARHSEQRNARSLVEILGNSVRPYGCEARATFFLSSVGDDRYSGKAGGYFGNSLPLVDVLDALAVMPGVETGYHTRTHTRMGGMGPEQVKALLQDQMQDFERLGVLDRVRRVLAYPYGVRPTEQGIYALRELGFEGAVLAYPGVREARYDTLPPCVYDGRLMTDPFLIPRVCIGAFTYAHNASAKAGAHVPIDPLEDFRKDVERALPLIYVSRGAQGGQLPADAQSSS